MAIYFYIFDLSTPKPILSEIITLKECENMVDHTFFIPMKTTKLCMYVCLSVCLSFADLVLLFFPHIKLLFKQFSLWSLKDKQ